MLSVIINYFKNKFATKPVEEKKIEPSIASISTPDPVPVPAPEPVELPKEEPVVEEIKVKKPRTRKKK